MIREYHPSGVGFKSIVGIYVLIIFAILTPVLAIKQRRFGVLVVWAVLVYSAVMMRRMVTPSGIVVVLLAAHLLVESDVLKRLTWIHSDIRKRFTLLVLLVLIGVTLYSIVERARYFMRENQAFLGRYPIAMADYMIEKNVSGRILNTYGMGGYLIYRLSQQNEVYIDGRTEILYPLAHMEQYEKVTKTNDPVVLREELTKYSVDQIIWQHTQSRHNLLQEVGGFGLDFMDARLVLYTREPSNFSLFGKLLSYPECWQPEMLDELILERQTMDYVLPTYSALFPFADLVVGYTRAEDGKAFIDDNIDGDEWFDEMRRFAGYRFLEMGEYNLVVSLLGGVELQKTTDFFASSLAMIKMGEFKIATQILDEFSNIDWVRIKPEDSLMYYRLQSLLARERELSTDEKQKIEALKVELEVLGYSSLELEREIDVDAFCTLSNS